MLRMVEMDGYRRARPAELSGGQQQRIALARTLVLQPKALLMDEPLSNLDEELSQRLRGELLRLHERLGFTLIYVTHDRAEASDIATHIVCMRHGRIERSVPIEKFKIGQPYEGPLGGQASPVFGKSRTAMTRAVDLQDVQTPTT